MLRSLAPSLRTALAGTVLVGLALLGTASAGPGAQAATVRTPAPVSRVAPEVAAESAPAADAAARALLVRLNVLRAARGIPPLRMRADLRAYALRHARAMAGPRRLVHSTGFATLCCWARIGEDVAVAPSAYLAHVTLVHSPRHVAAMLDRRYTEVGIGAVSSGGRVWVTEVFRGR